MLARHLMLRDASHKQVIHKFSFIHSLDLSGRQKEKDQKIKDLPSPELATSGSPDTAAAIIPAMATASTIDTNWYQSSADYGLNLAEIIKHSSTDRLASEHQPKSSNYLGKILFALATSYCLFAIWWLFGHHSSRLLTAWMGGKQIVLSQSDVEFLDYAERSLETVERDLAAAKAEEDDKVVYVPVYTPPATPSLPSVANLPLTALPSTNTSSIPEPLAKSASEPLKIPSPPPLPDATPIPTPEPVAIAKPAVKSTLIGILELEGDKSAALIKVEGKTRRVWLGEKINNDGWILDSVGNQTANITYQGETRSISVGENF